MKRVALIDDHGLVRAGLRALVQDQPGYEVVAEGADGSEVHGILSRLKPDILLLDISMKHMSGLDALRQWRTEFPDVQILILSMHTTPDYVLQALRLGASGYLLKDAAAQELELALRALSRNESYLSPGIAQTVIQSAVIEGGQRAEPAAAQLTPRQIEILRLIVRGVSTREIASGLGLSVKTVDAHRAQIMDRLKLRDVPSLVLYALRKGLVSEED
ncbi:MAG: DNA-binding response regulator [Pseudomonas sp.]|jgi:DNA-binding NarL/FixJ family response regulator|uniref:LuxR family two component transcriptional regulator n=1 Tax=Stutzerimonas stutzeri TaxID=316 RepID=A0A5S5B7J1_STUST|nr:MULTISPECIES: response regulator transcription factor [Stutzerimonas]MAX93173.1 DNA-binding response regulator [Pseudomonas sp.]MBU0813493.1 response regulator transcription factor [Gammaproteobacteria bacterium]MBK3847805.1 response regulator [Stutzerimonas xanthomarina]MBK58532.1 DNA-binding response regulator [Pseudomonas sp.]MBU0851996.1 response regulator transcription factor [Gammaproteobacteria bacterium]|tara:strand:- start:5202 stop:5852 length:651 start_codon:yes stop_codon:yes gene_type:complete